jgi:hypothetical protein
MILVVAACSYSVQVLSDSPRAPKPLTTDEAVKLSSIVFVGKAERVFITKDGVEVPDEEDNPLYVALWLEVKVKKVLASKESVVGDSMLVNYTVDGSSVSALRKRYLSKELIYFVQVVRTRRNANGTIVVDEHRRFTHGRRTVYPYPIKYLSEVLKSLETSSIRGTAGKD